MQSMHVTSSELALGTVQWGLDYGIANQGGRASEADVVAMLALAQRSGIDTLDTARAYGEAEALLGRVLLPTAPFRLVTKLSPSVCESLPDEDAVEEAVRASLEASRRALARDHLDVVLLHRPEHRFDGDGVVWRTLKKEVALGTISALGVSASSPESALQALDDPSVRVLQVASSLLDRRLEALAFFEKARDVGVEVHLRSVFLQGLAFLEISQLPAHLLPVKESLERIDRWATEAQTTRSCVFLAYALSLGASRVLMGCERLSQLEMNLAAFREARELSAKVQDLATELPSLSAAVLNPAHWPR